MNEPFAGTDASPALLCEPAANRPLWLYWFAVLLVAAAAGALLLDLPVARFCLKEEGGVPDRLSKLFDLCEVFGHGMGVALIALTVLVLDPAWRRRLARLFVSAYGAGLAADLVKILVGRTRPKDFDFAGGVWSSFTGWLPVMTADSVDAALDSSVQSFPSAHTATAVGLAIALTHMYPRGRRLFAAFAVFVALQRITTGAHYVSDALAGAAIASAWAAWCTDPRGLPGRWLDKWEA